MARTFEHLVEKYGVPFLVIPNTPCTLTYDKRWGFLSGSAAAAVPKIDVAIIWHQRIPLGQDAFLLVKSQLELPLNEFSDLEARVEGSGIKIVEYKRWKGELVRLTLETDVIPISRDDILRSIRRVLFVSDWRSMGDCYVDFATATPGSLEDNDGYHFYFPSAPGAPGLTARELPASGALNSWNSADDFFDFYKDYFTREDIEVARPETVVENPPAPSHEIAAREAEPRQPCSICSQLAEYQNGFQKIGREEEHTHLPAAADSLQVLKDLVPNCNGVRQLKQCPECATCYLYREEYEFLIGGSEDEQQLTRLTPEEASSI